MRGTICLSAMRRLTPAARSTIFEYGVTSDPVPAVVGTAMMRLSSFPGNFSVILPEPKKAAPAPIINAAPPKTAPAKKTVPAPANKAPAAKKTTRIRKDEILKKLRLSKADKKFFYGLLMHARAAFGAQVQYHSDDALTRKDAAGERAGMATHMADLGTDNYRRDFELGLLSDGVDVLEMIDEALQRLEDSEYGICLDCGEPIPRKRLEAKPYAKYCTKCKSKREEMDETFYHRR